MGFQLLLESKSFEKASWTQTFSQTYCCGNLTHLTIMDSFHRYFFSQRFCCQKGRPISVLSELYDTSYLFYVTLYFLCNIICSLISVFVFSLVTLSRTTKPTNQEFANYLDKENHEYRVMKLARLERNLHIYIWSHTYIKLRIILYIDRSRVFLFVHKCIFEKHSENDRTVTNQRPHIPMHNE